MKDDNKVKIKVGIKSVVEVDKIWIDFDTSRQRVGGNVGTCLCNSQCEPQGGPMGNPNDSDSSITPHPGGYDNGVQTQEQFWHLK